MNKLTNLDSILVKRDPSSDNKQANKKYVDDSIGKRDVLKVFQTLDNYLRVSVGNDTYNLTKNDKIRTTDITIIKNPNKGRYLLQNWVIKCNDKNINGKIQHFIKVNKNKLTNGSFRSNELTSYRL